MQAKAHSDLSTANVLIVEDELLIALNLESMVEDLGCRVLGPAGSLDDALAVLSDGTPDAALLDVNLRGSSVTPVAWECRNRGIPFALITGYGRLELGEPILDSAPRLRKPVNSQAVLVMLKTLLDGGGDS
jgi:DNA-binding NtrC family response regulator